MLDALKNARPFIHQTRLPRVPSPRPVHPPLLQEPIEAPAVQSLHCRGTSEPERRSPLLLLLVLNPPIIHHFTRKEI